MPIEFQCNICQHVLKVGDEHAGKSARCPSCQQVVPIPFPEVAAKPAPGDPFQEQSNPYQTPAIDAYQERYKTPHRGGLILTLGIFAILCNIMFIPGILAWIMGNGDIKQMDAGTMDESGRGVTQAGMIIGMVMTGLQVLGILMYIAFIIFIIAFGAVGAAAGG